MQYIQSFFRDPCYGEQPQFNSAEPPPKRKALTSRTEYILLSLLEIITSFFTLRDVSAFGLMNQSWKKKIIVDTKKHSYIDKPCSFLISFYVQNLLHNSAANPMTSRRLLTLAKVEKSLKIKTSPSLHIHYFHWTHRDYLTSLELQQKIRAIPINDGRDNDIIVLLRGAFSFPKFALTHITQAIDTQVEGHGLAQLNNFTTLYSLTLGEDDSPLTDTHLAQLSSLAGTLESFIIRSSHITDVGLKILTPFTALKKLTLKTPDITDNGLTALSSLTALQSLSFERCKITGVGLKALNQLTELQSLIFNKCNYVTIANVTQLASLPMLQHLSILYCTMSYPSPQEDIEELEHFSSLRSLNLTCCKKIESDHLDVFNKLTQLHSLDLFCCKNITESLIRLNGLTALRTLNICLSDPFFTPDAVVQLINEHPKLQNLRLHHVTYQPHDSQIQVMKLIEELKSRIVSRRLHVMIGSGVGIQNEFHLDLIA